MWKDHPGCGPDTSGAARQAGARAKELFLVEPQYVWYAVGRSIIPTPIGRAVMLPSPRLLRQVVRQAPLRHGITQGYARLPPHLRIKGASQARGFTVANGQPSPSSSSSSWGRAWRAARLRARQQTRRCNSSQATDGTKPTTLSGRMKEMSRKYGWTVTGIYLGLSVLDFPFCFLAVKWFGTERVAEIEHTIMDGFWNLAERAMPSLKERRLANEAATAAEDAAVEAREAGEQVAEQAKHKNPGRSAIANHWCWSNRLMREM